jgi:hypothetical protein
MAGVGSAVATDLIGSKDIKNDSVRSVDLKNDDVQKVDIGSAAVGLDELTNQVKNKMHKFTGLEADGPYPGYTVLSQGDNSRDLWKADSGASLQASWVKCAPGKVALGGGFSRADESAEAIHGLQIVSSRPATYQYGKEVSTGIKGDPDGSIRPNAWVVEGFNNGSTTDLVVRPWVVCGHLK